MLRRMFALLVHVQSGAAKLLCCISCVCSRQQLVYAWGECIPLPALEARMEAVQSLLLLLSKLADAGAPELNREGLALKTGLAADR